MDHVDYNINVYARGPGLLTEYTLYTFESHKQTTPTVLFNGVRTTEFRCL